MLLHGVDWDTYVRLRLSTDGNGSHVRLVYNDGTLLIEMPHKFHEVVNTFVGRLLELLLDDHDIDFSPLGSNTWQRELERKGIEAYECYYIQHVAIADDREQVDLDVDPPPDLAIEIEIANPLLPKLPAYAGIGVPEIWHLKGWNEVRFLSLDATSGTYVEIGESQAVPSMTPQRLGDLLGVRRTMPFRAALKAARDLWQ